ncbi:cell wall anchor protein [Chryseobacterium sp.]|uniref:cell wall anchor protein n=1 Tax=Chryseobacterium sp. TaxID=1871047 RepID=UPI002FC7A060
MKQVLIENLGLMLATLATGFGGWFFGRKKATAEVEASQIENAENLLNYYKSIVDDLGGRLEKAIEALKLSEIEKQEVIKKFTEATDTIHELEKKVDNLTEELRKYKQLSGKSQ